MTSIIEGYNYDIFISYRQKDNKYDSWVTEFVDNLQKELEATFKEEISVYFDINPHDGLLETHDAMVSELCMISQVRPLRVLSGRTAAVIAATSRPIPEIADEIDFDYIIEGSVLNVSDSIYLQIRLIQAYPEEKLVWTSSYKSDLSNIIKLHHNIANEIAGKNYYDVF